MPHIRQHPYEQLLPGILLMREEVSLEAEDQVSLTIIFMSLMGELGDLTALSHLRISSLVHVSGSPLGSF